MFDPEWCRVFLLGNLISGAVYDEFRCRFLGVEDGSGAASVAVGGVDGSVTGGGGLIGSKSNGSGAGWVPILVLARLKLMEVVW